MLIDFSTCNGLVEALHGAPIKNVFHVGAHLGEESTLYAASDVKKVIWFEANAQLIPALMQNIAQFPQMNQFVVPFALFDETKTLAVNVSNNLQCSSLYKLGRHADYYPQIVVDTVQDVQAYRLDALIDVQPPCLPWSDADFINIDTQGAELAVLKGMGRYIDQPSLKGVYLEVNAEYLYQDIALLPQIDTFMSEHGFARVRTAWTQAGWGDAFFLKTITTQ